jgi:hypothetical protein
MHTLPEAAPPPDRCRVLTLLGTDDLTLCVRAGLNQITASWRALRSQADSERPAYRAALHAGARVDACAR